MNNTTEMYWVIWHVNPKFHEFSDGPSESNHCDLGQIGRPCLGFSKDGSQLECGICQEDGKDRQAFPGKPLESTFHMQFANSKILILAQGS